MSDERSERLRRNRNRAKERVQKSAEPEGASDEHSEPTKQSKPEKEDETSKTDKRSKLDETDEPSESSVKDERVGTYMYLPESQQRELSRLYNVLKAEYEYEYDTEFEKNRHFYPLVIEHGIDSLDGLDALDIKTKLDGLADAISSE
jgi:hypothetical protein